MIAPACIRGVYNHYTASFHGIGDDVELEKADPTLVQRLRVDAAGANAGSLTRLLVFCLLRHKR